MQRDCKMIIKNVTFYKCENGGQIYHDTQKPYDSNKLNKHTLKRL